MRSFWRVNRSRRDVFLSRVWWLFALLMLLLGGLATVLGFMDASHPVYLSVQVVGLSYVLSGLTAIGGALAMWVTRGANRRGAAIVTAIAGGYIAGSFALYARSYRAVLLIIFLALFAVSVLLIAVAARSADLRHVGKVAGALGLSLAVIFTGAQLWYGSIYEPRNTDIAMTVSASAGAPYRISRKLVLLPVTLEIQNHSSLTALVLNSLFTATAIRYHSALQLPQTVADNEINVGLAQNTMPQSRNVNYPASSAGVSRSLVAISRVVGDDSLLLPNATVDTPLDLELPPGKFQEVDVETDVDYARTSRVSLGGMLGEFRRSTKNPGCIVGQWRVRQSHVLSFLRGPETLTTDWCTGSHPYIETNFGGSPTAPFSAATVSRNDAAAAFIHAAHVSMLTLHLPADPRVTHPKPPRHRQKRHRQRHCHRN